MRGSALLCLSFILSESATLSRGVRSDADAILAIATADEEAGGLMAIPAGNTAGLRLALPGPYNLQHGMGPLRT